MRMTQSLIPSKSTRAKAWRPGLILILTFSALSAHSEPTSAQSLTLSRTEIIQRVSTENPQVASARAEIHKRKAQAGQVRAARFPAVSWLGGVGTGMRADLEPGSGAKSTKSAYDFSLGDIRPTFYTSLFVVQPLYTFGKIDLRADAAQHAIESARAQVAMTASQVTLEAVKLYEAHLYAKAILLFLDDMERIAKDSLEDTQNQMELNSPDVSEKDVLRLKSALGLLQVARSQAEAGREQSLAGLKAYLGLDEAVELKLKDDYLKPLEAEDSGLERWVALAQAKRPEMKALKEGILAFQKLAEAEEAGFYPNFALAGSISAAYTPDREWTESRYIRDVMGHFVPVIGVVAQWQLQWAMPAHRAEERRAEAMKLAGLLKWAQNGIPATVTRAFEDVKKSRASLRDLKESVPLSRQWLVRASADYEMGLGKSSELTDASQSYVMMKHAELTAVYQLNVALAELAYETGSLVGHPSLYPGRNSP